MLEISELTCHYGTQLAISGVTFSVPKARVVGLLGPNGAGKSTTMKAVCGLLRPTSGEVRINGHPVNARNRAARRAIGYLPEHPPLYPDLTVSEYLHFCAGLRGLARRVRSARIDAAIETCDLKAVRGRIIGRLSKGYQQRVGIGQALIHEPEIVVLDEPTIGLDPNQIREIRALVRNLGSERTVLLSTHILSEVEAMCDEVVLLHEGEVAFRSALSDSARPRSDGTLSAMWRQPPPTDVLATLPGVRSLEVRSSGAVVFSCTDPDQVTRALLETSLKQGWNLIELSQGQDSLEDVFFALTQGRQILSRTPPGGANQ